MFTCRQRVLIGHWPQGDYRVGRFGCTDILFTFLFLFYLFIFILFLYILKHGRGHNTQGRVQLRSALAGVLSTALVNSKSGLDRSLNPFAPFSFYFILFILFLYILKHGRGHNTQGRVQLRSALAGALSTALVNSKSGLDRSLNPFAPFSALVKK